MAPCIKMVDEEDYKQIVEEINRFLNGGHIDIKKELTESMHEAAESLDFERAKEAA